MKNKNIILCIGLALVIIFNSNCKKSVDPDKKDGPLVKSGMADANADISTNYLINSIMLNGQAKPYYPGKVIISTAWKQIAGPSTASIENSNSLNTKVTDLQTGIYQFELTVYDDANHFDIDTMTLNIGNSGAAIKQLLFSKVNWSTAEVLWVESWLEIAGFYTFVPSNTAFEVFIRRESSPDWHQVIPIGQNTTNSGYVYSLSIVNNPVLRIDELPEVYIRDKPDIKIVF